ncbi:tetratricopeptide repeat protein [Acetobacter oeni]|nr:tetratricopeptide repeat protein [Acetobacter oeni]MBB3884896.1 Flp pilus assembly protein TadD [Acetobacter oeni]
MADETAEAHHRAGNFHAAERAYLERIRKDPDDADTLCNYGGLLCDLQRFEKSHKTLTHALSLDPENADAWCNLGNALLQMEYYTDAAVAYKKCLQIRIVHPLAMSNLGVALDRRGDHALAQKFHRNAVWLAPDNAYNRTNYALSLLTSGNYADGFREFEWRWNRGAANGNRGFVPQWQGEICPDCTLLITPEGGFGDIIQFARFLPAVALRMGRLITVVPKNLLSLMRLSFPGLEFLARGEAVPVHDFQCPILSLPLALGTTLDSIPGAEGYLCADTAKVSFWAEKIRAHAGTSPREAAVSPKVGLVWAGAPRHETREIAYVNRRRSVDLATFAPLARMNPGVVFYSLQIGDRASQAGDPPFPIRLIDYTAEIVDFSDTAALMSNLDLIITVDTSAAHLAAALGHPVWMLSRHAQCWRWLTGRTDSPWYSSLRIYRQKVPSDWSDPVQQIATDLAPFVGCKRNRDNAHSSDQVTI